MQGLTVTMLTWLMSAKFSTFVTQSLMPMAKRRCSNGASFAQMELFLTRYVHNCVSTQFWMAWVLVSQFLIYYQGAFLFILLRDGGRFENLGVHIQIKSLLKEQGFFFFTLQNLGLHMHSVHPLPVPPPLTGKLKMLFQRITLQFYQSLSSFLQLNAMVHTTEKNQMVQA